jgi:gamma-glutamylcyclotransferase (GGCT)/AIG2-like uncharacterized protein YtfP
MKNVFLFSFLLLSSLAFSQNFDDIGLKHNQLMKELIEHFGSDVTKDNVAELSSNYLTNKEEYKSVSFTKFKDYSTPDVMLEELKDEISTESYNITKQDIESLEAMKDYNEVAEYVEERRQSVELNEGDKSIYLSFLSVLKHSAYLWDENGENAGQNIGGNGINAKINWWKVAGCDAVGAIGGGIIGGGNGALVGACVASACSGINQW